MDTGLPEISVPFNRTPQLLASRELFHSPAYANNFARNAKWCPDGSAALIQCEDRSFQIFSPQSATGGNVETVLPQSAPILDYAWYPAASPQNPAAYCFVASVRECPVRLLDASDGRLRASYKIVDHRERQIAPHSIAFNPTATRLYCGFEDAIEVFDVQTPGEGTRLHTSPSKKSKDGVKGIISALAFSPSYDESGSGMFAAGSLTPSSATTSNIALFSEDTNGAPFMFVGADGAGGGVRASATQLRFNPMKPHILYGAFRRHDTIYAWDLRGDVSAPVNTFQYGSKLPQGSVEKTNQKRLFDVSSDGRWLAIGDQVGSISMFDLNLGSEVPYNAEDEEYLPVAISPTAAFSAHDDAVGAVAFHPWKAQLLSVSGSRHFDPVAMRRTGDEDEDEDTTDESEDEEEAVAAVRRRARPTPFTRDASVKVWDFADALGIEETA